MLLAVGFVLMTGIAAAGVEAPDWCTTLERWEAKGQGGSGVAGGCPIAGSCDIPAVRDNHAPDASTPFKVIRVHFIVFREDDGSSPAANDSDVIGQMERMNRVAFAPGRAAAGRRPSSVGIDRPTSGPCRGSRPGST